MMNFLKFEDFKKIDFRIGEIKEVNGGIIKVNCGEKDFNLSLDLNVKKGDKIVVIVQEDRLIIPVAKGMPLVPEKTIDSGSKVE